MQQLVPVVIPKWGLTMEDAEVVGWLVDIGNDVIEGAEILELETDKTNGFVLAQCSGTLVECNVKAGDLVIPGQVVGNIQQS